MQLRADRSGAVNLSPDALPQALGTVVYELQRAATTIKEAQGILWADVSSKTAGLPSHHLTSAS